MSTNPIAEAVQTVMAGRWYGPSYLEPVASLASLAAFIRLTQRTREANPGLTDEELFRVVYDDIKPMMEWITAQPTVALPKEQVN